MSLVDHKTFFVTCRPLYKIPDRGPSWNFAALHHLSRCSTSENFNIIPVLEAFIWKLSIIWSAIIDWPWNEQLFFKMIISYLWINVLKFDTVCFYCMPIEGYWNILKLSCKPLDFTSDKAFLKSKKRSGTTQFWRKIFLLLYSINWPNFIVWLSLFCEILDNICIVIVC